MSLLLQQLQPPLRLSPAATEPRAPRKDYIYFAPLVVGSLVVLVGAANVFSRATAYLGGQQNVLILGPAAALSMPLR